MSDNQGDAVVLVQGIVLSLVDEPEQVQISSSEDGDTLTIEIRVSEDDVGKVIGRQGRIIKAIRTLARAASSYVGGSRIEVEVVD
ncbi:MAG: KH domain-containing protein [Coriobacteriia bacterium]|nr:KH domain-containing protein [Coriobacteriia bacterium]